MRSKNYYIIIALIAIIAGTWYVASQQNSEPLIQTNNPNPNPATDNTPSINIEDFVRENISQISPIKEQVGGKFYVTSIEAKNGKGVVSYEDGHNAYTADFEYSTDSQNKPTITTFTVRQ
jgi:hypothetical protein